MPQVKMPDGQIVDMPDQLTPELAARLKSLQASQSAQLVQPKPDTWVDKQYSPLGSLIGIGAKKIMSGIGEVPNAAGEKITDVSTNLGASPEIAAGLGTAANVGVQGLEMGVGGEPDAVAAVLSALGPRLGLKAGARAISKNVTSRLTPKQVIAKESQSKGYVSTPTATSDTKAGATLESFTNKQKLTAKTSMINAEARGNDIRNEFKDYGLGEGSTISIGDLEHVRDEAYKATQAIKEEKPVLSVTRQFKKEISDIVSKYSYLKSKFPDIAKGPSENILSKEASNFPVAENKISLNNYIQDWEVPTTLIKSGTIDTGDALKLIQNLRRQADSELSVATGKKIDPYSQGMGQFHYYVAQKLEDLIAQNLVNKPELLQNFKNARTTVAKTYAVQSALNPATGEISGPTLSRMYKKEPDLFTGGLKRAAEHATAFPMDNKDIARMGSHAPLSAWDFLVAGGTAFAGHPGVATAELGARWGIPSLLTTKKFQQMMIPKEGKGTGNVQRILGIGAVATTQAEAERARRKKERNARGAS